MIRSRHNNYYSDVFNLSKALNDIKARAQYYHLNITQPIIDQNWKSGDADTSIEINDAQRAFHKCIGNDLFNVVVTLDETASNLLDETALSSNFNVFHEFYHFVVFSASPRVLKPTIVTLDTMTFDMSPAMFTSQLGKVVRHRVQCKGTTHACEIQTWKELIPSKEVQCQSVYDLLPPFKKMTNSWSVRVKQLI